MERRSFHWITLTTAVLAALAAASSLALEAAGPSGEHRAGPAIVIATAPNT